jgi:hypothetical protein
MIKEIKNQNLSRIFDDSIEGINYEIQTVLGMTNKERNVLDLLYKFLYSPLINRIIFLLFYYNR